MFQRTRIRDGPLPPYSALLMGPFGVNWTVQRAPLKQLSCQSAGTDPALTRVKVSV